MFRIDSEGATVGNRFTEGDPALSIPATVVSADIMNSVQEEIIKTIESMGITLDKGSEQQHYQALIEMHERGGRSNPFKATISNDTGPADITDDNNDSATFIVDRTIHKYMVFKFDVERKSADSVVRECGLIHIMYDSKNNAFIDPIIQSHGDDAGVIFSLAQVGLTDEFKLQYTSNNLTGASYVGRLDITSINKILI